MYFYYMVAAMGPQYQKYLWWKRYLTNFQMVQFVCIFAHSFQLVFSNPCGYPVFYGWFIGAHGVLFFILFSGYYSREYLKKKPGQKSVKGAMISAVDTTCIPNQSELQLNGKVGGQMNGYSNGHVMSNGSEAAHNMKLRSRTAQS